MPLRALGGVSGAVWIALSLAMAVPKAGVAQSERTAEVPGAYRSTRNTAGEEPFSRSCSASLAGAAAPAASIVGDSAGRYESIAEWSSSLRVKTVLLSFIDTREQSTDRVDNPDMSRRLLVFIHSMRNQYSASGLTVVLVDGSPSGGVDADERLVNFPFDHDLVGTTILSGNAGIRAMREFRVRCLPTTFLIDRHEQVNSRWEGLVLPSTLAKAIVSQGPRDFPVVR